MVTVSAEFAVMTKDNVVVVVGTAIIKQSDVRLSGGGGIKWYEDKVRQNQPLQIISNKKCLLRK